MSQTDRTRVHLAIVFSAILVGLVPAVAVARADAHLKTSTSSRAISTPPRVQASSLQRSFWDGGEAAHQAYLASMARTAAGLTRTPNRVPLKPKVALPTSVAPVGGYSGTPDWYGIAACESGGRWDVNTGNGYWGGLQFAPSTWFAYGGGPFDGTGPFPYSSSEQIAVGERVFAAQGPGAWPNCFRWK
jgi:Transglycosylase-like domain